MAPPPKARAGRLEPGSSTPERLVAAAERLFATHAVGSVSLRDVIAEAAVRNASAVQYYFGDRRGLLQAVIQKHHPAIEARRHALLDQYERGGGHEGLRPLADALVRPLAAELANEDGGAGYLQLMADVTDRPDPEIDVATVEDPTTSFYRWRALTEPHLDPEAVRMHRRFTAVQFVHVELARRARGVSRRNDALYVSHLVDLVHGLLVAPVSDQTREHLELAGKSARSSRRSGLSST